MLIHCWPPPAQACRFSEGKKNALIDYQLRERRWGCPRAIPSLLNIIILQPALTIVSCTRRPNDKSTLVHSFHVGSAGVIAAQSLFQPSLLAPDHSLDVNSGKLHIYGAANAFDNLADVFMKDSQFEDYTAAGVAARALQPAAPPSLPSESSKDEKPKRSHKKKVPPPTPVAVAGVENNDENTPRTSTPNSNAQAATSAEPRIGAVPSAPLRAAAPAAATSGSAGGAAGSVASGSAGSGVSLGDGADCDARRVDVIMKPPESSKIKVEPSAGTPDANADAQTRTLKAALGMPTESVKETQPRATVAALLDAVGAATCVEPAETPHVPLRESLQQRRPALHEAVSKVFLGTGLPPEKKLQLANQILLVGGGSTITGFVDAFEEHLVGSLQLSLARTHVPSRPLLVFCGR